MRRGVVITLVVDARGYDVRGFSEAPMGEFRKSEVYGSRAETVFGRASPAGPGSDVGRTRGWRPLHHL